MPITLISGPANAGKAQLAFDAVRAHIAHASQPLLVVPTRADGEHYLRELAGDGAVLGVRVERFDGLVEEAVRRAGGLPTPLGEAARRRLIAAAAAARTRGGGDDGGAGSADAAGRPPALDALARLFAELQEARVSPARLGAALEQWTAADGRDAAAGELASMFSRYVRMLARLGRPDAEQRAVLALDALRRAPALWGGVPVVIYGFDDFTRLQLDVIETLGAVVDAPVTVSLTFEPGRAAFAGRAATLAALAPIAAELRELPPRSTHYSEHSRGALSHLERSLFEPDAPRARPDGAVRLLQGAGERDELELVAAQVRALLRDGTPAEEIAVVLRASGPTLDVLEEVFAAAGVPIALQRRRRFADSAVGRALVGLLRAAGEGAGAGAAESGDGDGRRTSSSELLAWLRAPGVLERGELADALELEARRAGVHDAARELRLWEQRRWPLAAVQSIVAAQRRGAGALIDAAARELERLFAAPRSGRAPLLASGQLGEARALVACRRALAQLRELAETARALAPSSAAALAQDLEEVTFFDGQPACADRVSVLDPLALRARRVRALFLCGLQEGVFPAPARRRPFLAEDERRRLAEVSGLRLGEHQDTLAAERYLLYAIASRPRELLVLGWHASGEDGEPAARSLFVDDVCDLFDASLDADAGARVQSPPRCERAASPARAGRRVHGERLGGLLADRVWSASSLELWIACPVRWFVERLLGARPLEPAAEPLARGGLAHAALRDTFEGLRREFGSARLQPSKLARARELLAQALERGERERPLSVAPERAAAVRMRLRADLERYLELAAQTQGPLEPRELELGFGFDAGDERAEGATLPAAQLGDGLALRGRIDRLDVGAGGEAVVYDYKGRQAPPAARWQRDGDVQVALYMRAAEQLLGVRAVGGFYQPLTGSDLRPRGVLDGEAGLELECVRSDVLDGEEMREKVDAAVAAARAAAGEAARGELEGRPQTCSMQGRCLYPSVCRCEW